MSYRKSRKPVPRGCAVFFGVVFILAGVVALVCIGTFLVEPMIRVRAWPAVTCTVLQAEVERRGADPQGNPQFAVKAELSWDYNGTRHTGGKLDADAGFHAAESVNAKEELCHRLRRQPQQTCYVNPDNPDEAILRQPEWWPVLLFAGLAAFFVVMGIIILRGSRHAAGEPGRPGRGRAGALVALVLGLALMGGGVAVWWFAIRGATDWKAVGARMKELPCTIAGSTVKEDRGSGRNKKVTYRPVITFSYQWDGRTLYSEWYNFNKTAPGSSSRSDALKTLRRYPRNSTAVCWVDPEQPWVCVLEKSGANFQWLWIPVTLFLLLGGFFCFRSMRMLGRISRQPPPLPPPLPPLRE